jgi:hypothetical protein
MAALCWKLPNFFLRTLLWLRSLGKYRLEVVGVNNLPAEGPVILATDAAHLEACLQVLTATDRSTRFALVDQVEVDRLPSRLLRLFASGALVGEYRAADKDAGALERVIGPAARELTNGNVLALAIGGEARHDLTDELLAQLRQRQAATLLPVYHGVDASKVVDGKGTVVVRVVIGAPLPPTTPAGLIRKEIDRLGEWASRHREEDAPPDTTAGIPGAAAASPTATAATPPGPPSSR